MPTIIEIRKNDWEKYDLDRESALLVKHAGEGKGHDFFVNMDNICLQTEMKGRTEMEPQLLEAQYKYGMVLIGLALLKEFDLDKNEKTDNEKDIYEEISMITKAMSPFLLPTISSLGDLH